MVAAHPGVLARHEVPVEETWDLSPIYPSDEAWEADLPRARQVIAGMAPRAAWRIGDSAA